MNHLALKIMMLFVVTASTIAMILLGINFICFALLGSDTENNSNHTPQAILREVSENIEQCESGFCIKDKDIVPDDNWCILIDESGNVIWEQNKPDDVPTQYSIQEIIKMRGQKCPLFCCFSLIYVY